MLLMNWFGSVWLHKQEEQHDAVEEIEKALKGIYPIARFHLCLT